VLPFFRADSVSSAHRSSSRTIVQNTWLTSLFCVRINNPSKPQLSVCNPNSIGKKRRTGHRRSPPGRKFAKWPEEFGIRPQADDPTFLLHNPPSFEDKLLGAAKVILLAGVHGPWKKPAKRRLASGVH
jgi:hypothetical protein